MDLADITLRLRFGDGIPKVGNERLVLTDLASDTTLEDITLIV